jgi:hypothetical protein
MTRTQTESHTLRVKANRLLTQADRLEDDGKPAAAARKIREAQTLNAEAARLEAQGR